MSDERRANARNVGSALSDCLKIGGFIAMYGIAIGINELAQQVKHGSYHIRRMPHKRMPDNYEHSFSYYEPCPRPTRRVILF